LTARLGRGDYLIAAHLALEMCQLILVIQMMMRDEEKGTNMHRFGGKEAVPIMNFPPLTDVNDCAQIMNIHNHACEQMNKMQPNRRGEHCSPAL